MKKKTSFSFSAKKSCCCKKNSGKDCCKETIAQLGKISNDFVPAPAYKITSSEQFNLIPRNFSFEFCDLDLVSSESNFSPPEKTGWDAGISRCIFFGTLII
jgi:hypothetical protein